MNRNVPIVCALLIAASVAQTSPAGGPFAYEGFDYAPTNQLAGQVGSGFGIGVIPAHSLTDFRYTMGTEGLTYATQGRALSTTGRSVSIDSVTGGTQDANLPLLSPVISGDLYFSFLVKVESATAFGVNWGLLSAAGENGANAEFTVRSTSAAGNAFGVLADGIDDRTGPPAIPGNRYLVVGRISGIGGAPGAGTSTVWFNPSDLTDVAGSAGATIASSSGTFTNAITHIWLSLGNEEDAIFDEIRLGTTLVDVVPSSPVSVADIYEGFDYGPLAELQNQPGSGTGIGVIPGHPLTDFRYNTAPDGLNYTDGSRILVTSGRATSIDAVTGGTQDANLPLVTPIASGDIYFSFLIQVEAVSTFGLRFGFLSGAGENGGTAQLEVRSTSAAVNKFGNFSSGGFDDRTGPDAEAGNLYFVVGQVTGVGGGAGTGTLTTWFNPTDLSDVPGSAAVTIASTGGTFASPLDHIWLALQGEEDAVWDEIRAGPSLASVVPFIDIVATELTVPAVAGMALETSPGITYGLEQTGDLLGGWLDTGTRLTGDGDTLILYHATDGAPLNSYRASGQF